MEKLILTPSCTSLYLTPLFLSQTRGSDQDERPLSRLPPHRGGLHHLLHRPPHGDHLETDNTVGGGECSLQSPHDVQDRWVHPLLLHPRGHQH